MKRIFLLYTSKNWHKLLVGIGIFLFGETLIGIACLNAQALTTSQRADFYQKSYERTIQSARQNGWPLRTYISPEKAISLQRTDALGNPVYYVSHSTPLSLGTRTEALYTGGALGLTLNGGSVAVRSKLGMWDGGRVRADHRELSGKIAQTDAAANVTPNNHATHMAGILAGRGVEQQAMGMAFGADLQVWDFDNDLSEIIRQASTLLLSNHAYGPVAGWVLDGSRPGTSNDEKWEWWGTPAVNSEQDYRFGFYDETVREIDRITYNFPYFLMVRSADNKRTENGPPPGKKYYLKNTATQSTLPRSRNDGYDIIPGEANAKNVLTVGAANVPGTSFEIASYSGWGPTDDGRIKPDVVGIGTNVLSSVGNAADAYGVLSGTSMASANVTGSLLLLQELYQQQTGSFMLSSTLKGVVLHTADKPSGQFAPSYEYGWGLLNTEKGANVILNKDGSYLLTEKVLRQGTTFTQKFVASGTKPLVVTICWTDPEAAPTEISSRNVNNTSPKLVNDLDIVLQEGFNSYQPWVLDPAAPAKKATTGNNIRDNIEQVYLPNPVKGRSYTLTVSHKYTLKNGQQPFALIVSGIEKADCQQAALLSVVGDTTLCSGQTLTLAANAGNSLVYEWYKNGTSIKKGSDRFLDITTAGSYSVQVTGSGCTALSKVVTVRNSPVFADIAQKGKLLVCDSKGTELSANTGIGYAYQWFKNGNAISGAVRPQHQATETGIYQVRISYQGCSALSIGTQVEVTPVMASLDPAANAAICNGTPAVLKAPSQAGYSYLWYYNNAPITGAATSSYLAALPGRYAVEVHNGSCQVRSADVIVQKVSVVATILPPPTTQIATGSSLALRATYAMGNRYSWYRNDSLLRQETAPQITVNRAGTYKVSIENSGCRAQSEAITLWGTQDASTIITALGVAGGTNSRVVIWPNPAQEMVVVSVPSSMGVAHLEADLLSSSGQILHSQPFQSEQGFLKARFDVRALSAGPYLIRIKMGDHSYSHHLLKH